MKRIETRQRAGAAAVEAAIVFPVLLILIFGILVGGTGVFRYQQVACEAREAARWASVRGADYQRQTNQTSPTQQQIFDQAVLPYAPNMDATALSIQVEWINGVTNTATAWDASTKEVRSITSTGQYVSNSVRVTVQYQWSPGMLWTSMTLQSVTQIPMSF
jgi:Flp pilus assembly protein TadG